MADTVEETPEISGVVNKIKLSKDGSLWDIEDENLKKIVTEICEKIKTLTGFHLLKVDELPEEGEENVIYLVPDKNSEGDNVYNEFVYIADKWEPLGSTKTDLSDYYTKEKIDELLALKQNNLTVDKILDVESENPIANSTVTNELAKKIDADIYNAEISKKVDIVEGKDLSSNDFTDELKEKLEGITVPTKVADLEDAAEYTKESELAAVAKSGSYGDLLNKPKNLSDFINDKNFIDRFVNDLENYYQKSDVYTKEELQPFMNKGISIQVVETLPEEGISESAIYLVKKSTEATDDIYDEYIHLESGWERIGSTAIDLSEYVKKSDLALNSTQNTMLSGMNEVDTDITDDTYDVQAYASPDGTKGAVFKRKFSKIWDWIKGKLHSVDTYIELQNDLNIRVGNDGWGKFFYMVGNPSVYTSGDFASIGTTNGNCHIDSADNNAIFLNFYRGNGGVYFGNGNNEWVAKINNVGTGFFQNGSFDNTVNVGIRNVNELPSGYTDNYTRLRLLPPYHTEGPWDIVTQDSSTTAYLKLYYGNNNLVTMDHNGNITVLGELRAPIFRLNDQNIIQYKSSSFNGYKMHDNQANALYIEGREAAPGDSGGIAITNDGVTVFGAGDTDGVLRIVNEDAAGNGSSTAPAVAKVYKDGSASFNGCIQAAIHADFSNTHGRLDGLPDGCSRLYGNGLLISAPDTTYDQGWIRMKGSTEVNELEIGTGDDGNESIIARQYNIAGDVVHSFTLLNANGNSCTTGSFSALQLAIGQRGGKVNPLDQDIVINGLQSEKWADAPGIGFHIPGYVYATLKYTTDGAFKFLNHELSDYVSIVARDSYAVNGVFRCNRFDFESTFGQLNSDWVHFENNGNKPYYFDHTVAVNGTIRPYINGQNLGESDYRFGNAYINYVHGGLGSVGFGADNLTYYQTADPFYGNYGWCHYIIANHGNGETYYNYTIGLPFWGTPMYQRQAGSQEFRSGWHRFITDENIESQNVAHAVRAAHAESADFATVAETLNRRPVTGFVHVYDSRMGGYKNSLDTIKSWGNFSAGMYSGGGPWGTEWTHALTFGWGGADEQWSSQIALNPHYEDRPMMYRNGTSGWKTVATTNMDNTFTKENKFIGKLVIPTKDSSYQSNIAGEIWIA